jgi:predicted amidohydrolase YtcJ
MSGALILRDVEVDGCAGLDVRIEFGRIAEVGAGLPGRADEVDGKGGALIPGLVDHHIHLFALAAQAQSVALAGVRSASQFEARIDAALAARAQGQWLRATGYHQTMAGELGRELLDAVAPRHPIRVQHQTGSLWGLNSLALTAVGADTDRAACIERDGAGRPTGRIWRGDAWLRQRLAEDPPSLTPLGRQLARFGITAVTDASVTTDAEAAARLAAAHRASELPQRLTLMSGGELAAPPDGAFEVGAMKVLLDDHDLPPLDAFIARIGQARSLRRALAVHCVTAAELALTLAALGAAGARAGDRIEHGGVIPAEAIAVIRGLDLTVVTQPAFVAERGERYLAEVDPREQADLYRCASLRAAGIPVAASSDAPYASPDPWRGIAAAVGRLTATGQSLGAAERVSAAEALSLYLGASVAPGRAPRRVQAGAAADLCLLKTPSAEALDAPSAELVAATMVDGRFVYAA